MTRVVQTLLLGVLTVIASTAPGADVLAAAARIDALVTSGCERHGVALNPDATDEAFLRRVCLDVIGRIPTYDEALRFLADRSPDKRHTLIEHLLASEGYVSAQYDFWADLLRVQTSLMGRYPGDPYIDWIKQAIRTDMPYDRFVSAMITSKGPVLAAGNGATGYYLRDAGMPQDNMSNTVQVFLGTRLACAQCHNHPFDTPTRMQYLQMAAYTNGIKEEADPTLVKALKALSTRQGEPSKDLKTAMNKWTDSVVQQVSDPAKDTIALPKDYQYPDGKAGKVVQAHALFGAIAIKPGQNPREAYAAWLTSPENPRFTITIANRLWKRAMGLGLIEPLDNMTEQTVASDPELMACLVSLMKEVDYDLRAFQDILYHTKAYQRAATATAIDAPETYRFPGPVMRRLSAEQVWDSMLTWIVPDVDDRRLTDAAAMYAYYQDMSHRSPEEIWGIISQIADAIQAQRETQTQMKALETAAENLDQCHTSAEFQALKERLQTVTNTLKDLSFDRLRGVQIAETDPRWKGIKRDLVRASELPSPTPPGHFLRDFGQSDRLLIDNYNRGAAVTQALTLLNGTVDQDILQPKSILVRQVASVAEREGKLRMLFLSILSREPTDADLQRFVDWKTSTPDPALTAKPAAAAKALAVKQVDQLVRAVAWTLINSREFLFEP